MLLGTLAILGGISYWAGQPDYALLFRDLEPTDANRVVESLQEQKVSYDLRENGTAVFVPREEVYELRLSFAGEGLISNGSVGYELFDEGTLGMTDFMQKLNMKRALEGELVRIQGGEEVAMKAGDFWRTPGGVEHAVRTGDAGAVVLDVFAPPRDEYRKPGEGFGV